MVYYEFEYNYRLNITVIFAPVNSKLIKLSVFLDVGRFRVDTVTHQVAELRERWRLYAGSRSLATRSAVMQRTGARRSLAMRFALCNTPARC
jgi:hypothetical protein